MPGGLPEVRQVFTADSSGYSAAIAGMIADNKALVASIKDVQREIKQLGADLGALPDRKIKVDVDTAGAMAKVAALKKELDGLGDRTVHIGGDNGAMLRELRDISAGMDMLSSSAGRMEEHLGIINRNAADSSASLDQMTQILRDNADAHNAAAAAVAAHAAAQRNASSGSAGWAAAAGAAAAGGGRGGGGAGWAAAAAAAAAGGGGGGGGFMTAADYADKMMPWIKRWSGIAHYAIMGINEALATILPATMAAGAATLVGWQGVEQMIPRIQAINATAESIGPAYGISSGQYLGTGNAIQRYQNLATGGVYELGGAGINLMRQGGGSVGQVGLSTIAMIDRGVADMQNNMAARGTMGTLSGILGQGTGYLQQFGGLGANLGNIFLGLAPHLPGVGGDYLSALQGITGGLAGGIGLLNQHGMGNLLGLGLAGEAGWRVGTPMLGLLSRFIGGGPIAKLGGMLAEKAPLGSGLESLGFGISGAAGGAADFLGALTGPEVAAAAGAAFLGSKLYSSMPSPAMRQVSSLQAGVNQAGFSAAFQPLAHAIVTAQGLATGQPTAGFAGYMATQVPTMQSAMTLARFGPGAGMGPSAAGVYQNAATGFAQTTADLVNAGPQLVSALQKAGLKGVSMADAFQIAQNALLDTTHAFGKNGKLNQQALTMLSNYGAAIKPMTQSAGGFNAMIAAQQIMGSPAMKDLATVNQQADSMTQIMSGGPAGMAALFGLLGGSPTTVKKSSGIQLSAPPAFKKMAQALTSFTTTSGAGAWNAFAGSSGLVAAEQQNLDQLRTYMTLGALPLQGKTGAQGIAGFQLEQMLPLASKSPAALAMLMQQGAQMGVGSYYDPSKSFKDNLKAAEQSFTSMAGSAKQVNQGMNNAVIASSNLPATAAQFSQGVKADIQSQRAAAAATDIGKLKAGGMGSLGDLVSQYKASGYTGAALQAAIKASLQQGGITGGTLSKIMAHVQVQADTSQARAAIANLTHVTNQPKVNVKADVAAAQAAINAIKGKDVPVAVRAQGIAAIQAAIDAIHGKTVTITTINRLITQVIGMGTPVGGVAPATTVGGGGMRFTNHASGGRVPGYGGGDIVPAMLEPGEAIVPKHLVPSVAGFLGAHKVPGFAGGGFVGQQVSGPLAYWGAGSSMAMWNPAVYAQLLAAMRASQGQGAFAMPQGLHALMAGGGTRAGVPAGHGTAIIFGPEDAKAAQKAGSQFTVHVIEGMHDGMKDTSPEAKKLAQALVGKLRQEIQYAQGAAQAAAYGQGYDPSGKGSGIFGNMNLASPSGLTQAQMHASPTGNIKDYNAYVAAYAQDTTGGNGPQSVQDQMKSYLGTERSFGTDIGKLRKQHLNKAVLAQLIAAGPQQGDALAQSILGGQGGVKSVNKLWGQIQQASKKIGAQAAMGQYGGHLSPDLKNATVVGKGGVAVNISVNAGKSGSLDLTKEQIAAIVAQVQAALLKQAKRNTKTGTKLPGKSS